MSHFSGSSRDKPMAGQQRQQVSEISTNSRDTGVYWFCKHTPGGEYGGLPWPRPQSRPG